MTLISSDSGSDNNDMGHWHSLNFTGCRGNTKRQRHATLAFLRIDMRHQEPPSRAQEGETGGLFFLRGRSQSIESPQGVRLQAYLASNN